MTQEYIDLTSYSKEDLIALVEFQYDVIDKATRDIAILRDVIASYGIAEDRVLELLKKFFYYLDYTEESDGGNIFHPIRISCCRAMMTDDVGKTVEALKQYLVDTQQEIGDGQVS